MEAAVALAAHCRVTLAYRGSDFYRVSKDNQRKLNTAAKNGAIEVMPNTRVTASQRAPTRSIPACNGLATTRSFSLVRRLPPNFSLDWPSPRKRMDPEALRLARRVIRDRVYDIRREARRRPRILALPGLGCSRFAFFDRPWSFWYTVLYTAVITIFGLQAVKRWGFNRKDNSRSDATFR